MIFDKLAGVAERHLPEIRDAVEQSRLFVFEGKAKELLPKKISSNDAQRLDMFTLPFPTTAVEDKASIIILSDEEDGQIGLDKTRHYIEAMPFDVKGREDQFLEDEEEVRSVEWLKGAPEDIRRKYMDSLQITIGTFSDISFVTKSGEDTGYTTGPVQVLRFITVSKKYGILYDSEKDPAKEELFNNEFVHNAAVNVFTALEEIIFFSSPDHFTLKTTPAKDPKKKGKKIPRSEQRPIYTMLKPREIRDRLGLSDPGNPDGSKRRPHERRAHYRQLRVESGYKENRIVPVKASWIGPSEAIIKNKKYKVMLELFY